MGFMFYFAIYLAIGFILSNIMLKTQGQTLSEWVADELSSNGSMFLMVLLYFIIILITPAISIYTILNLLFSDD